MTDVGSLCLYFFSMGISVFGTEALKKINRGKKSNLLLICFVVVAPIVFIQGFRYKVGSDYISYMMLSKGFAERNHVYLNWYKTEPLFIMISALSYRAFGSFFLFFVDALLMNIILFVIGLKYIDELDITKLYLVYYLTCFPYFLNAERQGIAVLLVWLAFYYISHNSFKKYAFCLAIAVLFHNTALIGVVFGVVFLVNRISRRVLRDLVIICAGVFPLLFGVLTNNGLLTELFGGKYKKFLDAQFVDTGFTNFVFWLALDILVVYLLFKSNIEKDMMVFLYFSLFMQLSSYLLNRYIDYGFRISFFFEIGFAYAYANLIPKIRPNSARKAMEVIVFGALMFNFVYKYYVQGNSLIFPYNFIWNR